MFSFGASAGRQVRAFALSGDSTTLPNPTNLPHLPCVSWQSYQYEKEPMDNSLTTVTEWSIKASSLRDAARSENTRAAYHKGWRHFVSWCESMQLVPQEAKPEDVVNFFIQMATEGRDGGKRPLALNTLRLYRSALNDRWRGVESSSPASAKVVDDVLRGLARTSEARLRRVKALRETHVLSMLNLCGDHLYGLRDAALLSVGFAAALRRSELCYLKAGDLERKNSREMVIHLQRSKTDQRGGGQKVAVIDGKIIRPISHLDRWLSTSGISHGFAFQTLLRNGILSGRALDSGEVARVVKRYVKKIGLDPREYSGHSLRAGFVTSAAVHHARIDKIMEVTRHRSAETVLKYIRDEEAFVDHAGASFL